MKNTLIWIIIIFLCAAVFRLTFLDLIEFKLDEARDVYEMEKFYQEPYFIQRGTIQSTGVYNPPLWYDFLALISLPSRDPQYLSFVIALINCLAVAGFYLVVRKFYGSSTVIPSKEGIHTNIGIDSRLRGNDKREWFGVAEIAGLLLAFSPWAILFSRKIWAPDLILPLLVPLFYFLHKKNAFWVVLLLSLLAQLHASGIFLALAVILILAILHLRGVKAHLGGVLVGLAISLIPLLPYIAYQFQTGCEDCRNFFNYQSEVKAFDVNVFLRPFQIISGSSFQIVLGDDYENFLEESPFVKVFNLVFLAEFILAILGIVYIIKKERKYLFLLTLLGVVPVLYLITQTPAHMHYFVIVMPIMIIINILGLAWFKKRVSITIITAVVVINILFNLSFFDFLNKKQNIQGDFGPIYRVTKDQAEEKLASQKNNPDYELIKAEYFVGMFNSNP